MNTPLPPHPPENTPPSDAPTCPSCGAPIPPGAPNGICPRCALAGVAAETPAQSTVSLFPPRFEAPSLEAIAQAFPQFEVIDLIGAGGMGAVYKARQPHLDRFVALKVLPQSLAEIPAFTERFTREGRLLAKLNHPNIVGVYDFGQANDLFFLTMEYVDGVNLREAMRAGRFTPKQALDVVPKICAALQFAHEAGVLHRDIKPENILLDTQGRVKIADFGIAKLIGGAADQDLSLTGSRTPGTPSYMAPEQIEQSAEVDHRADIYSLGVVFYEMLTGELPIGRFAPPSEKTDVNSDVDSIVFRTLEKEPARRQQTAGEVKTQVEGLAPSSSSKPPPQPAPTPTQTPSNPATPTPPSDIHSPSPASRSAGKAALLLSLSLILLIAALSYAVINSAGQSREIAKDHQISAIIADLDAHARALKENQREIEARYNPDHPLAVQAREEVAQVGQEIHELGKQLSPQSPSSSWRTTLLAGPIILILACIILVFLIIIPTIMGWRALRKLRLSGQHRGRISAAFAALLVPLLIVDVLIFLLVAAPATGSWQGPAISFAGLLIVAADIWLIWLLWRWLNSPPSPEEQAAYTQQITPSQAKSSQRWIIWLVVALVFLPVLLLGGCAVLFFGLRVASHDQNGFSPGDLQRLEAPAPQVLPVPNPPRPTPLPEPDPSPLQPEATPIPPSVDPFGSPSKPNPKPKSAPKPKTVDPFG